MSNFKEEVLKLIDVLEDDVQGMREDGETDLRSVLHYIEYLRRDVDRLEEDGEYLNG